MMISVYFFFSSRRRHTRCSRDWSSDVCSSDLLRKRRARRFRRARVLGAAPVHPRAATWYAVLALSCPHDPAIGPERQRPRHVPDTAVSGPPRAGHHVHASAGTKIGHVGGGYIPPFKRLVGGTDAEDHAAR